MSALRRLPEGVLRAMRNARPGRPDTVEERELFAQRRLEEEVPSEGFMTPAEHRGEQLLKLEASRRSNRVELRELQLLGALAAFMLLVAVLFAAAVFGGGAP